MKPILFNTEMVQAILEGRKVVTRRVVKLPKRVQEQENGLYTLFTEGTVYENFCIEQIVDYISPYQVNDVLYVRETVWQKIGHYLDVDGETKGSYYNEFLYVATDKKPETGWNYSWVKRPSIHMPKEAARLFLRVTGVTVERLQDITKEQINKEGFPSRKVLESLNFVTLTKDGQRIIEKGFDANIYDFLNVWNKTLKKDQRAYYCWEANPYVWVIEFEVIDKPIE